MTEQERANKIFQWKVLISHGDIGEAAVIYKELMRTAVVRSAPPEEQDVSQIPNVLEDTPTRIATAAEPEPVPEPIKVQPAAPTKKSRAGKVEHNLELPDGQFTIKMIVAKSGVSQAIANKVVNESLAKGKIRVKDHKSSGRGRPERIFEKVSKA